ncbi:MAG: SAM-dependent methyltransferase, partial [Actinomycetota bacterium]|nr:SAM-dependent methyltransferase [Actinomycetota bacterium]
AEVATLLADAERIHVVSVRGDWHARRTKRGRWLVSRGKASDRVGDDDLPGHDRVRQHPLSTDDPHVRPLLVATGLVSPEGRLRKQHAGKYRQVQHYVELLRPLPVWDLARREARAVRILDAGCGKAYLSLALYAFARARETEVELIGLDANPDVVATVAEIAERLGYDDARFEATTIWEFAREHAGSLEPLDLLVSLHACDTATDEALAAGVVLDAEAIVVAPCCQHELARQLQDRAGWAPVLRHGLLRGRLADLLTDSLRATALELFGYRAEVIEFAATEHTAKNVMIRAARRHPGPGAERRREEAARAYAELAEAWGVKPTLERLLADRWPLAPAAA